MPSRPIYLIDPEVLVPSPQSATNLVFWERMNDAADDLEVRVGLSTMAELEMLADAPPATGLLSSSDFWRVLSKFMARGIDSSDSSRNICEIHLRGAYKPVLGHAANIDLLLGDMRSVGGDSRIALRTVEDCWTGIDQTCPSCVGARVDLLEAPGDGSGDAGKFDSYSRSLNLARVWRKAFLDEHPEGLEAIADFASEMFPSISFSTTAWSRLSTLSGSRRDNVSTIVGHLGVLNDEAIAIWAKAPTTAQREAELGSRNVVASPESPKTHKNKRAMGAHRFVFGSVEVLCEWHTKIRPNVNRVYFAIDNGLVRVGSIEHHLPV